MRTTGKTDVTGLFKYFKEHVDPEFVRFETSFRSRSLPELARLASFFKSWNDNPSGSDLPIEAVVVEAETDVEVIVPDTSCEQLLQDQEKRLAASHAEEIGRLEAQLRESARTN